MKFAFNPAFSIARVIALPPPWTTIGLISTASRNTMSRATLLRTFASGESMKLPPYLTSNVAALAMRSCMLFVSAAQRTGVAHIPFVERNVILGQIGGIHQRAGFAEIQIDM